MTTMRFLPGSHPLPFGIADRVRQMHALARRYDGIEDGSRRQAILDRIELLRLRLTMTHDMAPGVIVMSRSDFDLFAEETTALWGIPVAVKAAGDVQVFPRVPE